MFCPLFIIYKLVINFSFQTMVNMLKLVHTNLKLILLLQMESE